MYTITSHRDRVHAVWLTDTKLVSGDGEGVVTVRDFLPLRSAK